MKIIGWHLLRLAAEAESDLCGGVVESIRRDKDSGRLLMILGSRRGKRYLVIGARGSQTAFFWTHGKTELHTFERCRPTEALNRLRGARLQTLMIPCADRWARLAFTKPPREDGDMQEFSLVITWTGAAGNVRLLHAGTDTVLEAVWPENESTVGARFAPPRPPSLIDWRDLTFPEFLSHHREAREQSLAAWLPRRVWGLDATLADEIVHRIRETEAHAAARTAIADNWRRFEIMMRTLRAAVDPGTLIFRDPDQPDLGGIAFGNTGPVDQSGGRGLTLAHALALIDQHLTAGEESASLRERVSEGIARHAAKARRRLTAVQKAAARGSERERIQRTADMLAAQRHLLRKGMGSITLPDWDTGAAITIALDPAKTPQENIDSAYQRARTAAGAIRNARKELPSLTADHARWEKMAEEVRDPETDDRRLAAIAAGCGVAISAPEKRDGAARRVPYREFLLGEARLWVGRSRRDNDELTLHYARPHDLFFHAQGTPGSHVILKRQDRSSPPDHHLIACAAEAAAYFSKAKHSGLVPVAYTEVRYVRKPRKAPAGLVRLEREETVMVKPKPPPGYHEAG